MRAMIHTTLFIPLLFLLGIGVLSCSRPVQESQPTRVDSLLSVLNDPNTETVLVVAHRGGWRNTVENSFESLQNATQYAVSLYAEDLKQLPSEQSIASTTFFITTDTVRCAADGDWPTSPGGAFAELPCPRGYSGALRRWCDLEGVWGAESDECGGRLRGE